MTKRQGTINLIKNLMKHKVNIVNEYEEYDEFSEDDESENTRLRRQLNDRLKKDSSKGKRKQVKVNAAAVDDEADLNGRRSDSDGGAKNDWNNLRTGGPIQLLNEQGNVVRGLVGKSDLRVKRK